MLAVWYMESKQHLIEELICYISQPTILSILSDKHNFSELWEKVLLSNAQKTRKRANWYQPHWSSIPKTQFSWCTLEISVLLTFRCDIPSWQSPVKSLFTLKLILLRFEMVHVTYHDYAQTVNNTTKWLSEVSNPDLSIPNLARKSVR